MQMQDGSYRGISAGEVVEPEKAFNYMRRSMAQTLSSVFGAMTLLADSFMEPLDPAKIAAVKAEGNTTGEGVAQEYGSRVSQFEGLRFVRRIQTKYSG